MRIPWMPREKASMLLLRRKFNYSIGNLSSFFGRSRSLIHKIFSVNRKLGTISYKDLRRLPGRVKKLAAARQQHRLFFYMKQWQAFILGESDRPP